mmetsp:Transcript_17968/g.32604  ORF Transcript_17968/g.32604 Transcript_17968/m.32604 type:complete len:91 (+) Transcript_17968:348-620(+)
MSVTAALATRASLFLARAIGVALRLSSSAFATAASAQTVGISHRPTMQWYAQRHPRVVGNGEVCATAGRELTPQQSVVAQALVTVSLCLC